MSHKIMTNLQRLTYAHQIIQLKMYPSSLQNSMNKLYTHITRVNSKHHFYNSKNRFYQQHSTFSFYTFMNKQRQSQDKTKIQLKKIPLFKQNSPKTVSKSTQNAHTDQFVFEPITTVSGQKKYKKYQKIKKIGKGTYSQCFLVKTVGSDSQYALKIIPKNKLQVLIRQKLIYEIKIQQQLSHPYVVYLDHWFEDEEFQYIFMEYCSNGNLESKLQQAGQFQQSRIKTYTRQIIESLMYIHSKGVLHRDLKMCNFYLDENDHIKLGDFGFACQLNNPKQLKRQTCGTPNYIAPEAISGFGYSFSADVWAVGVILYRMKFAYCPFQGASVKQTLENVKLCKYNFPKTDKISSQLKDLISKIFNINYDERLTLDQIISHPFFQNTSNNAFSHKKQELTKEKRGFSLSRLFSSSKQKSKKQTSKVSPKNAIKAPVRSNSCQTFKKIKQTFKQKSINTLISNNTMNTQQNVYMGLKTQAYTSLAPSVTTRQNASRNVRDIIDSFNTTSVSLLNDFSNKVDRNSRITEFLAKQEAITKPSTLIVKDRLKGEPVVQSKPFISQKIRNNLYEQLLTNFQKKYVFPLSYTNYKDIMIVTFPMNIKLLLFSKSNSGSQEKPMPQSNVSRQPQIQCEAIILFKNKYSIYDLGGEKVEVQSLSKVLNYVIDKKIVFDEGIDSEEFNIVEPNFQTMLHKLPNLVLQRKEGVLMIYGTKIKGYLVAKSHSQDIQYLSSLQERKLNTIFKYNSKKNKFQVQDGPVISKIYLGWTQQLLSSFYDK